jgi:predicted SnoaL-like aldol condensation-catalyzing enzyme
MIKPILAAAAAAVVASCATVENSEKTVSNKEIVGTFLGAVSQGDADTMRELANPDYIQHNPFIPTGLEPFIELLPVLEAAGTTAENVRMFQDGDYVFMHNIWRNASPFGADEMVAFDIIRVDENGKVAEHWDALQPLVSETVSGRTQTDGPTEVTDLDQTEANKALAVALIEDVLMGRNPARITDYISDESYAQHNPMIADGLDGIIEAVETLTAQGNMFQYTEIHAVLGEGNFVLTVSEGEWSGQTHAFYDLFRMEDGMIVEHWDVIQPVPTEGLANKNGMFTGFVGVGPESTGQ